MLTATDTLTANNTHLLDCDCCGDCVEITVDQYNENLAEIENHEYKWPMCDKCLATFTAEQKPKEVKAEPKMIQEFRGIVDNQSMGGVTCKDGKKQIVDLFSASAVVQVWDKLRPDVREKLIAKFDGRPFALITTVFKVLNK